MQTQQGTSYNQQPKKKQQHYTSQGNLKQFVNPLVRIRTSPSKNVVQVSPFKSPDHAGLSKSFTASKDKIHSQIRSPKASQPKQDASSHEADLKLSNLQLKLEQKDISEQLLECQVRNQNLEDQLLCLKELTMFQRQTIEQLKSEGFDQNSRFWKLKSELTAKESQLETVSSQFRKQQQRIEELESAARDSNSTRRIDSSQQLNTEAECKRLQALVKEYKKELSELQKKNSNRDYVSSQNKELKEKLQVIQEVNELLRDQLKKAHFGLEYSRSKSRSPQSSPHQSVDRHASEVKFLRQKIEQLEKNEENMERVLKEKQAEFSFKERALNDKIQRLEQQTEAHIENEQLRAQINKLNIQLNGQMDKASQLQYQLSQSKKYATETQSQKKEIKRLQQKILKLELELQQKSESEREGSKTPQRVRNNTDNKSNRTDSNPRDKEIIQQQKEKIQQYERQQLIKDQQDQEVKQLIKELKSVQQELNQKLEIQKNEYERILRKEIEANRQQQEELKKLVDEKERILQQYRQELDQKQIENSKPTPQTQTPKPRSSKRKNTQNILLDSSEEEAEDDEKLRKDIGYYKKAFEDLMIKYQEAEVELEQLKEKLAFSQEQQKNMMVDRGSMKKSEELHIPQRISIKPTGMDRYQKFVSTDKESLTAKELIEAQYESEQHKLDLANYEDDLDQAVHLKLANLQNQLMDLTRELEDL